jgi:hypothetical protein
MTLRETICASDVTPCQLSCAVPLAWNQHKGPEIKHDHKKKQKLTNKQNCIIVPNLVYTIRVPDRFFFAPAHPIL